MKKFLVFLTLLFGVSCAVAGDNVSFSQQALLTTDSQITSDYLVDDYWETTDVKPGYAGTVRTDAGARESVNGDADIDFAPAVNRILAKLTSEAVNPATPKAPARILFTGRYAYHFYSTIIVNQQVDIVGAGTHLRGGATKLYFHGVSGIHTRRYPAGSASWNIGEASIQGLALHYVGSNTANEEHHGIIVNAVSNIRNVFVTRFPGHGIHVEGSVGDASIDNANVSTSRFDDITIQHCGKTGFWVNGKDAQVMTIIGVNSMVNGRRQIAEDGFGFYDSSMLGNTYISCHTRNNYVAGYRAAKYAGVAPNRSTYINCYSEAGTTADPPNFQEGPPLLDNDAMVFGSTLGNMDLTQGGASMFTTALGKIRVRNALEVVGANGTATVLGNTTAMAPGGTAPRIIQQSTSKAYGLAPAEMSTLYFVHDPNPLVRTWGFKMNTPAGVAALGFTDSRHLRANMPIAPRGILIGTDANRTVAEDGANGGARRLGYHDARNEATLATVYANALPGDVVLNSMPNKGAYNFVGWIYSYGDTYSIAPKWHRYGTGMIGEPVPLI